MVSLRSICELIRLALAGAVAWISARLGALGPLLTILIVLMAIDFLTGMGASKLEAVEHPEDPAFGWSSKKGAKGIAKKVAYMCVIAAAMALDYLIVVLGSEMGFQITMHAAFGLLVTAWYILNELLSITENAGRMGAPVPEWLAKYIAALKGKIDAKADDDHE